jgi:hypothetical protein
MLKPIDEVSVDEVHKLLNELHFDGRSLTKISEVMGKFIPV